MDSSVTSTTPKEEYTPDLFKWHGAELMIIPIMTTVGILGNILVLYITHCRWKGTLFTFFINVSIDTHMRTAKLVTYYIQATKIFLHSPWCDKCSLWGLQCGVGWGIRYWTKKLLHYFHTHCLIGEMSVFGQTGVFRSVLFPLNLLQKEINIW